MKTLRRAALCLLFAALLPAAVPAQSTATIWSDTAEIVVKAPEPAMWKLTKGDSVVWVMGTLSLWPENFEWKQSRFLRLLKGSRQLIVPASQRPTKRPDPELPGNQTLQETLTPATYDRFAAAVQLEGFSLDTYQRLRPPWAGFALTADFLRHRRISILYYPPAIRQAADQDHIPIVEIADEGLKAIGQHFNRMDAADGEACLSDYLDNLDYYHFEMPAVAEAWAHSDLATVLKYYRDPSYITCMLKSKAAAASYDAQAMDRMTDAIRGALKKPGKVVAVVIVTDLLRKDGVLDQLKAEGVEVTAPDE